MNELKPCPFCGGKAYLVANDGARVVCGKCKSSTQALIDSWYGDHPSGSAVVAVIKYWNQRFDQCGKDDAENV